MGTDVDVTVIGAGQAGIAVGFYLDRLRHRAERHGARPLVVRMVDGQSQPGGAWRHTWPSLRLFSAARHSSLPGWPMPEDSSLSPAAEHVLDYLRRYEGRYALDVERPVRVNRVKKNHDGFSLETDTARWTSRVVICATGTWGRPLWPMVPGITRFGRDQIHSADYRGPEQFAGKHVLVVGAGNSAAQIVADLAGTATVTWSTRREPRYLPDDIDGAKLFELATAYASSAGTAHSAPPIASLGDIVVVPAVAAARAAGHMRANPMVTKLSFGVAHWADGSRKSFDATIWCTGFRPDLPFLRGMPLHFTDGTPRTDPAMATRSADIPNLYFVGYGDWCGAASATLIGVGPAARATVDDIARRH